MKLSEHINIFCKSIKLLYSLSKRHTIYLVLSNFVSAILPYVPIYFSARLIDALSVGESISVLAWYAILTVGTVFLLSLLNSYLSAQRDIGWEETYMNQHWRYSEKAMEMAYESIEDRDVSILCERIKREFMTGYNLYYLKTGVSKLVLYMTQIGMALSLTLSFFMVDTISVGLKLAFVGGIILTVAISLFTTFKSEKLQNDFFEACVDLNMQGTKYNEYLNHYSSGKDIRLYGMEDSLTKYVSTMYHNLFKQLLQLGIKNKLVTLADAVGNYALRFGTYMLLIFAALQGGISVGAIAQYVSCVMMMLTAISGLVGIVQTTIVNHKYLKRYFSYFDISNDMYQGSLTVEKRDDTEYHVEFRDVSFKYPHTDTYALRHVNLKFKVGEKLAVVGMNGSGKTTFIKLMCRLYDPTEGEILLNGVNIKKYDYDEYMSIFSVVFQDFQLFSFSLGQNVAAKTEYDPVQVIACLNKAGFGDRLATMPKGLDTGLYQDFDPTGVEISGGEAQKIALARALYKNAPFIILDEPTAALDPISEYEVYNKFNQISGTKTAIYISHRLASCRFCDKIAVFHEGAIIQNGSHAELVSDENGKYYELWNAQAQYYS